MRVTKNTLHLSSIKPFSFVRFRRCEFLKKGHRMNETMAIILAIVLILDLVLTQVDYYRISRLQKKLETFRVYIEKRQDMLSEAMIIKDMIKQKLPVINTDGGQDAKRPSKATSNSGGRDKQAKSKRSSTDKHRGQKTVAKIPGNKPGNKRATNKA